MTAIDLLIIATVVYVAWRGRLIGPAQRFERSRVGLLLIHSGLLAVGLFFAADLATMHFLPRVTGMDEAMKAMEALHSDLSWLVVLFAVVSISIGFIDLLVELQRREAEARESEQHHRDMQMELAHANRVATMGQIAASIAHEVKQPIAATLTNAETALRWLTREPANVEKATQAIERIGQDGQRAVAIIDGIRAFGKKAPARREALQINEAIMEVAGLTRSELSRNGVSLNMQLTEDLSRIEGDRIQLQQVILNLIVNAVEAMSEISDGRRELRISTESEPGAVLVAVRDSGPGLAEASLDRPFDAFYTTKPHGLGMGLSICRSIIDAHGGRLWAAPNESRGAVFCFTLPVQEA